jgi:hypothetical protein
MNLTYQIRRSPHSIPIAFAATGLVAVVAMFAIALV